MIKEIESKLLGSHDDELKIKADKENQATEAAAQK